MTSTIYDHVVEQIGAYVDNNDHAPRIVWLAPDLFRMFMNEMYSRQRIMSAIEADHYRLSRTFALNVVHESGEITVEIRATLDLKKGEVLIGRRDDLENFIAERELLCATTGVSTADTVTTSEKTENVD